METGAYRVLLGVYGRIPSPIFQVGGQNRSDQRRERTKAMPMHVIQGLGFGVWDLGLRVQGLERAIQGLGFRVWSLRFKV